MTRQATHLYPIGPAPIGWRAMPDVGWCSAVIPHTEYQDERDAELNRDHYGPIGAFDLSKPANVGTVMMFQNSDAFWPMFYPDALVIIEPGPPRHSEHDDRIWVRRLGTPGFDTDNPWAHGFWADATELSPITADILLAVGGRI